MTEILKGKQIGGYVRRRDTGRTRSMLSKGVEARIVGFWPVEGLGLVGFCGGGIRFRPEEATSSMVGFMWWFWLVKCWGLVGFGQWMAQVWWALAGGGSELCGWFSAVAFGPWKDRARWVVLDSLYRGR